MNQLAIMYQPNLKRSLIAITLLVPLQAAALKKIEPNEPVTIQQLPNAQVFAQFEDKLPAVLNYFTSATEKEVIAFYQQAYGKIIQQSEKRGRLTLYFAHDNKKIRVVISTQDRKRQVDILMSNFDGFQD